MKSKMILESIRHLDETYLTVNEAALFLKLKESTIYSWVHQRKIPYRKHGRKVVFCRRDLERWSEAQSVEIMEGI